MGVVIGNSVSNIWTEGCTLMSSHEMWNCEIVLGKLFERTDFRCRKTEMEQFTCFQIYLCNF